MLCRFLFTAFFYEKVECRSRSIIIALCLFSLVDGSCHAEEQTECQKCREAYEKHLKAN